MSFSEHMFLEVCQLKVNLYLHACFDILSCASIVVCAAGFENRYGENLELILNKPEKNVISDLLYVCFHCTNTQIFVRVRNWEEDTLWGGD